MKYVLLIIMSFIAGYLFHSYIVINPRYHILNAFDVIENEKYGSDFVPYPYNTEKLNNALNLLISDGLVIKKDIKFPGLRDEWKSALKWMRFDYYSNDIIHVVVNKSNFILGINEDRTLVLSIYYKNNNSYSIIDFQKYIND